MIAPTHCPVCKQRSLSTEIELDDKLLATRCTHCQGHWIPGEAYLAWARQQSSEESPMDFRQNTNTGPSDNRRAKLCPECRRIMLMYRVGHGAGFRVDRCGNCEGLWLDKDEWEALRSHKLHTRLHFLSDPRYQAEVRKEESRKYMEKVFRERLGDVDYERVRELKSWLDQHPHRSLILAHLGARSRWEPDDSTKPGASDTALLRDEVDGRR